MFSPLYKHYFSKNNSPIGVVSTKTFSNKFYRDWNQLNRLYSQGVINPRFKYRNELSTTDYIKSTLDRDKSPIHVKLCHELSRVSSKLDLPVSHIYGTDAQRHIIHFLYYNTKSLVEGHFKYTVGVSSRAIVGQKGIGKSTILQSMCMILPFLFPRYNLFPIYVSYDSLRDNGYLEANNLGDVIQDQLVKNGIEFPKVPLKREHNHSHVHTLEQVLEKIDGRILLIVDELDSLYRYKGDSYTEDNLARNFGVLQGFANSPSGRFAAIICGSSPSLPLLISRKAAEYDDLVERFPMLRNVTSLNSSKFECLEIDPSPPNDYKTLELMIGEKFIKEINLIAFMAGANIGAFNRLQSILKQTRDKSLPDLVSFLTPLPLKENSVAIRLETDSIPNLILESMYERNKSLFDPIIKDKVLNMGAILSTDWTKFKPLSGQEAIHLISKNSIGNPRNDLYYLADRGLISFGPELHLGLPAQVYPLGLLILLSSIYPSPMEGVYKIL